MAKGMNNKILDYIDFTKVNALLEGFNKSTGFVTAILDLEGNILSQSGWRQICTEFHRVNHETAKNCTISDTVLANKMKSGEKYHFYKCLNGLVDVAVPIVINGEHIANLFSGQIFFDEPDRKFFIKQSNKYGFNEEQYIKALQEVPVVSKEKVKIAMDFLLNMTQLISEITLQKLEQSQLNAALRKSEERALSTLDNMLEGCQIIDFDWRYIYLNRTAENHNQRPKEELLGNKYTDIWPGIENTEVFLVIKKCLEERVAHQMENEFTFPNGAVGWFDINIQPVPEGVFILSVDITKRKKAEIALTESEERFRSIFENSTVGIYRTTPDGQILLANPTLINLLGYNSFNDLALRNLEKNGYEPSYERSDFLDLITKNGVVKGLESAWKKADGTSLFISESARAIYDENNTIKYFDGIVEDITLRKKALDALQESEEKFKSITENSADAIFITDKMGQYKYVNKSVTDLLGYTNEEMLTKGIVDIASAEKVSEYIKLFSELLSKGRLFTEIELLKKNGEILPVDLNAIVLPGDMVYGSCRDISVRRKIQKELEDHKHHLEDLVKERTEKLQEALEKTRDLYENAPCGYHSLDSSGMFKQINDTELKWLGYSREEIVDKKRFVELLTPESIENFKSNFPKFIEIGHIDNLEFELIRKDNSTFWVTASGTALFNDAGEYIWSRSVLLDITTKKEIEIQLHKAKKEAEEANKAKTEFLANMSHEIRTPMNAVLGYAELLSSTSVDQVQKDYLNSIKSSGRSLLTLINDILDLSKIEAGKLDLEYEYIDSHAFFSDFEKIFSLKLTEKGLKFIVEISSGTPPLIFIDEARVRQIILNLLGNAVKFTTEGTIKLIVHIENPQFITYANNETDELIDLVIEVSDTGIGISKELKANIFEPFTQERSYKKFGGTGLGLSITKRLLNIMNGTIKVESEIGKGTTFIVSIPEISYKQDSVSMKTDIEINPADVIFKEAKILVVDDVEHNRAYLKDALKNTPLKIREAEDGFIALQLVEEIMPDLVIADIRMPNMDGFQLLDKIKSDEKLKHIPVLAYSASVLKAQKERIHSSEFSGLLIKPVNVSELYLALMNILPYETIKKERTVNLFSDTIIKDEIKDMPAMIHSLETALHDKWKTFAVTQPIDEIIAFASELISLGQKHSSNALIEYGNKLINSADNFNIDALLKLILQYQTIVENLKRS